MMTKKMRNKACAGWSASIVSVLARCHFGCLFTDGIHLLPLV